MQEFTTPGEVAVPADDNVVTALLANAERFPQRPALAYRSGDRFVDVSTKDLVTTVRELAAGLISLGIEAGSRVCLFMPARIEFTYLDYAIWAAGCATVTIYETSSADQVEWIVGNSGSVAVLCGSQDQRKVFDAVAQNLPDAKHVFVVDDGAIEELTRLGRNIPQSEVDARIDGITHDGLGTLVYTSGTTGRPKGCALTHGNLIWDTRQAVAALREILDADASTLAFLPLAHILARVVQVACVTQGVRIGYASSFARLVPEMQELKPTFIVAVPRVFEKVYGVAQSGAAKGAKKRIFERATAVAIEHSKQSAAGAVSRRTQLEHTVLDKLVYSKLRAAFGGRMRFALSGGAPLGERLGHFFDGAGVQVLEGYGLTETTGGATVNTPTFFRIGSVGRPVPGASARIAEDGEIMLKGGHIFQGYWRNPEATAAVLGDDGWFATGDIGEVDDDGFVRITGRKKDLIVTAGGKNVAPAVLEDLVRADRIISQCVVVGDARPFIACLVTLDAEELPGFAAQHGMETVDDAAGQKALHAEVKKAIDSANAAVSHAEAIKAFRILPGDFTIESGELTPSLKVRRPVVLANYAVQIEAIYAR
ncbi:MAG TPA: long-chain fatty acid--CoA ligase [Acidimicrobiales bacterium]